VTPPSSLLRIVSTDFLALRLFCYNIRQHGRRQILYFKWHVDGRKFLNRRPQVVRRCSDAAVLKLGPAVLLGSAREFSGNREAPSKKSTRRSWRKKFCV